LGDPYKTVEVQSIMHDYEEGEMKDPEAGAGSPQSLDLLVSAGYADD